ncbi:hypothetical protein ACIPY6_37170 [Streptomyces sp. NPDC090054]|uniref:hypothetical protein n=1 Tax=Streptomyces sp. NPDC090054 TaxID=3365933 RepID=UPI0038253C29
MQNLDPQRRDERLAELDFSNDLFHLALDLAAEDVRRCTDMDAPSMRGTTFWSRTNRYLAEQLIPLGWERTARDNILRMIHPDRSHVVTAISAAGGVGDLKATVRSKNPKGPKMARVVEMNVQLAVMTRDEVRWGRELEEMPTWCLLYKWDKDKGALAAELSLPVKMNGAFVDEWLERIPLDLPGLDGPGVDVALLDDPGDGDSPLVMVEFLGR